MQRRSTSKLERSSRYVKFYSKFVSNLSAFQSYTAYTNWFLRNREVHYRSYISPPLDPILSKSYPIPNISSTPLKSILILSSHLRLGLPKGIFSSDFPTKTLYAFFGLLHTFYISCLSQSSPVKIPNYVGEEYNACSSTLFNFLHSASYKMSTGAFLGVKATERRTSHHIATYPCIQSPMDLYGDYCWCVPIMWWCSRSWTSLKW